MSVPSPGLRPPDWGIVPVRSGTGCAPWWGAATHIFCDLNLNCSGELTSFSRGAAPVERSSRRIATHTLYRGLQFRSRKKKKKKA
eukprot:5977627-Prymnesium_polylepis.1